jgi:hypothetical protein
MVEAITAGRGQRLLAAATSDFWRTPIDVAGYRQQGRGMNHKREYARRRSLGTMG